MTDLSDVHLHTCHWLNKSLPSTLSVCLDTWQGAWWMWSGCLQTGQTYEMPVGLQWIPHLSLRIINQFVGASQDAQHSSNSKLHESPCSVSKKLGQRFVLCCFLQCLQDIQLLNNIHKHTSCQQSLAFSKWNNLEILTHFNFGGLHSVLRIKIPVLNKPF